MESDSAILVQALKTSEYDLSEIGTLLREARSSCILNFDVFEFDFCRRECNKVAHELAQYGARVGLPISEWIEHVPKFVSVLVTSDGAELMV